MAGHKPTKGRVVNKGEGGGSVGWCKIKKELSLCNKIKFSNPYIFKPDVFDNSNLDYLI